MVILEGKNPELGIINKVSELLALKLSVQIIFGANIYELYRSIYDDEFTKVEDLSFGINTFDLIKESGSETFKDRNNKLLQEYTAQDFAFIYLFFDFDPWSASALRPLPVVKNMLELFNDPTEQGKLYINYPSVESFNHITKDFQNLHYHYRVGGVSYKEEAGRDITEFKQYIHIKKIDQRDLQEIIKLHLQKANFICNDAFVVPDDVAKIEQVDIFDKQLVFYSQAQKTYVLSSIPIFMFEFIKNLLSPD